MKNLKRYQSHYDKVNPISELLGIKLAPLRVILDMSPDEFLGMEFAKILDEGAIEAKNKAEYKLGASVVCAVIGGIIAGFLVSFLLRRKLPKKG